MVARCSTDAATVFDDLRQAVRNIAFRSADARRDCEAFIAGLL
jgi:hypothetical protein